MNEERYITIETKISHHEVDIEELQKNLRYQEKEIKSLQRDLNKILSLVKNESNTEFSSINFINEKPPHY